MLAIARTFALVGIEAEPVYVELDVTRGLPAFTIVGLPDAAVRESRERVRASLVNAGFAFPLQRITANLAPGDLRKAGPGYDLALAAALLCATKQLSGPLLERYVFAGELALDGSIRPVPGILAMAERTQRWGMRGIVVAERDAPVAALVEGIEVIALDHVARLRELAEGSLAPVDPDAAALPLAVAPGAGEGDLSDLRGQPSLRRAVEVAAAGGHGLLMVGPPGAGKTLVARRLPALLPPLEHGEALEVLRIATAGGAGVDRSPARPFRAPHHTVSARALIGGGNPPGPGEVTRAHRGVLFLDELGEFRRDALEALREPLEAGSVTLSRPGRSVTLPCRFMLVAASNPCPCGHGPDSGECECTQTLLARYRAKLSGALADRIDIFFAVERPPAEGLAGDAGEESRPVRERVLAARERQAARLGEARSNAGLSTAETREHCVLEPDAERALAEGHAALGLSGRGWDSVLRVARTIADLDGGDTISAGHVEQALSLRRRPLE